MAILIMSIGIVSIATMFPLSIIRAAKATQLTQATDLRYNAEAMLDIHPRMVLDPNMDGTLDPAGTKFVIDPVGWVFADQAMATGLPFQARDAYGNRGVVGMINRYSFGCNLLPAIGSARLSAAEALASLPDSWEVLYEGPINVGTLTATGFTAGGATAGGMPQYPVIPSAPDTVPRPRVRVTIIAPDGVTKEQRMVTSFTPGTDALLWTEDFDSSGTFNGTEVDVNGNGAVDTYPLPAAFTALAATSIYTARLEVRDRRYTWLLTVRKGGTGGGEVDCVVFFKRATDNLTVEEHAYVASFTKGNAQATVTYQPGPTEEKPWVKKGGFIFDATNARWYRIAGIISELPGPAAGQVTFTIQLETPAIQSSPVPPPAGTTGFAILPKGVVDVFPLGSKAYTLP